MHATPDLKASDLENLAPLDRSAFLFLSRFAISNELRHRSSYFGIWKTSSDRLQWRNDLDRAVIHGFSVGQVREAFTGGVRATTLFQILEAQACATQLIVSPEIDRLVSGVINALTKLEGGAELLQHVAATGRLMAVDYGRDALIALEKLDDPLIRSKPSYIEQLRAHAQVRSLRFAAYARIGQVLGAASAGTGFSIRWLSSPPVEALSAYELRRSVQKGLEGLGSLRQIPRTDIPGERWAPKTPPGAGAPLSADWIDCQLALEPRAAIEESEDYAPGLEPL